jgi:hypothetical protein
MTVMNGEKDLAFRRHVSRQPGRGSQITTLPQASGTGGCTEDRRTISSFFF